MPDVMAVSFERYGRLYYLDPGDERYAVGDRVLVPTESGPEVAECVWAPEWIEGDPTDFGELPRCAGQAQPADLARDETNRRRRAEIKLAAKRLIKKHELPMKVVGVDYLDRGAEVDRLIVIYFTAPQRVDFRLLVTDLARVLKARIDLRQIGSRDAARVLGGIGSCGRDLCCATFLKDFEPISMRLAKAQGLPPNPMRISGACGRLMCCLKYEHPLYAEFSREAPKLGSPVETPLGDGVVVGHRTGGRCGGGPDERHRGQHELLACGSVRLPGRLHLTRTAGRGADHGADCGGSRGGSELCDRSRSTAAQTSGQAQGT